MNLSKSLYIRGLKCSKSLWLKKYKSDVLTPPDEQAKTAFEVGDKVGALAMVEILRRLRVISE